MDFITSLCWASALLLLYSTFPTLCFYVQPEVIRWLHSPLSQVLLANSSLVLECVIDSESLDHSLPVPIIKWQYNGFDSTLCKSNSTNDTSSICTIEAVDVSDTGWYRCAAVDGEIGCVPPCYSTITVSAAAYILVIDESEDVDLLEVESRCSSVKLLPFEIPYAVLTNTTVRFDIYWEKDGHSVSNMTEIQVLPSGLLFISSASPLDDQYFGRYRCIIGGSLAIKEYNVYLNESFTSPASLELSIISSFSSSDSFPLPNHAVELICQYTFVCSETLISWIYDGVELMDKHGLHWLREDSVAPGNYCCVLDTLSSCVMVGESENSTSDSSFVKIDDNEITSILLNCSSINDNTVYWTYNGNHLSDNSSVEVSTSSDIGVYQCLLLNTSSSPLHTHRILPFGLSNPPTSISLSIYPPHLVGYGTHIISCSPPSYLGGLDITQLQYKVLFESYDTPEEDEVPDCTENSFHVCNISCESLDFWDEGYRVFYVQMVNTGDDIVSQLSTGVEISAIVCDFYVPGTPIINFMCTFNSALLIWKKSNSFFPDEEYTVIDLACSSGEEVVEEYSSAENRMLSSGTIQFAQSLAIGDMCSYTAYGSSVGCTGIKTVGECTVTHPEEIIVSTPFHGFQISSSPAFENQLSSSFYTQVMTTTATTAISFAISFSSSPVLPFSTDTSSSLSSSTNKESLFTTSTNSVQTSSSSSSSDIEVIKSSIISTSTANTLLISVSVASGTVIVTILGLAIFCIIAVFFVVRIQWKKSIAIVTDTDWPDVSITDGNPKDKCQEVDAQSIITTTEQLVNNYCLSTETFEPASSQKGMEEKGVKDQSGGISVSLGSCSHLQVPTSSSGDISSCKTNPYDSGSNLSHKTSAYSSVSDSSGYSSHSEVSQDYLDYSYSKRTGGLSTTRFGGGSTVTGQSEEIEMIVLYRSESSCPPILEQGEDNNEPAATEQNYHNNELQSCHDNESIVSSHEDLSYENVTKVSVTLQDSSDFISSQPCSCTSTS